MFTNILVPLDGSALSEGALAALVTRDAMVGVVKVLPSKEGAKP